MLRVFTFLRNRLQLLHELFDRYSCLLEHARERAGLKFSVIGHDATRRAAAHDYMASALALHVPTQFLE